MLTPEYLHGPCIGCGNSVSCFDVLNSTRYYSGNCLDPLCALYAYLCRNGKKDVALPQPPPLFHCKKCFKSPLTNTAVGEAFIKWSGVTKYSLYDFISTHQFPLFGLLAFATVASFAPFKLTHQVVTWIEAGTLLQIHLGTVCQCNKCEGLVRIPENAEATTLV